MPEKVLYHDAPVEIQERFGAGYRHLLGDLRQRKEQIKDLFPHVREVKEPIIAANSGIED